MSVNWIHCNNCKLRYQPDIKFFLTACGHLQCERCESRMLDNGDNYKLCSICKEPCQVILLSHDLRPEIQFFFKPVNETLDKVKEVYMFQDQNMKSLLKTLTCKYDQAKKEIFRLQKITNELKRENQNLRNTLEMRSNCSATSTPMSGACSTANFHFTSPLSNITDPVVTPGDKNLNYGFQRVPGYGKRIPVPPHKFQRAHVPTTTRVSCEEMESLKLSSRLRPLLTPTHGRLPMPPSGSSSKEGSALSSIPMSRMLLNRRQNSTTSNNRD